MSYNICLFDPFYSRCEKINTCKKLRTMVFIHCHNVTHPVNFQKIRPTFSQKYYSPMRKKSVLFSVGFTTVLRHCAKLS